MKELETVVIETTRACNLNCRHCGSACGSQPAKDELNTQDWFRILSQIADCQVKTVIFSGGEPFLKTGFDEMIRQTYFKELRFGIISNGLNISDAFVDLLLIYKPFAVGFSIDGLAETHNFIRRHQRAWLKTINTIVKLQTAGIPISVVTTISKYNMHELSSIYQLLKLLGVRAWQVQFASPMGRMADNINQTVSREEFAQICSELRSLMLNSDTYPMINLADCFAYGSLDPSIERNYPGCQAGISTVGIRANGDVVPCLSLYFDEFIIGNLQKKTLSEIWSNDDNFAFNRRFSLDQIPDNSRCRTCSKAIICRGGCASISYSYYQKLHSQPFCIKQDFSNQGR